MPFCRFCGNEISSLATTCPRCGRPTTGISEVAIEFGTAELRLAGFWIRFAGFVIDGVIVAVLFAVVARLLRLPAVLVSSCPGISLVCEGGGYFVDRRALVVRQIGGLVVAVLYSALLIAFNRGRTLGAMVTGVRVARPDGAAAGLGRAFGRQAFAVVSRGPLFLGYLWAAWDGRKRTWHDMVAGTRVFVTR